MLHTHRKMHLLTHGSLHAALQYPQANTHTHRGRSMSPLCPPGKLPRLSPWRQVSMETAGIMRASHFSEFLRPLIRVKFGAICVCKCFPGRPQVIALNIPRLSDPLQHSFINLIQHCNASTKTPIHPQSNPNPRTLFLSPKGFNLLIPTFYYISHFLRSQ